MRRAMLTFAFLVMALPAQAGPYLFDLLKVPNFRVAWNSILQKQPRPEWMPQTGLLCHEGQDGRSVGPVGRSQVRRHGRGQAQRGRRLPRSRNPGVGVHGAQ